MSSAVAQAAARAIGEHAIRHDLKEIAVVFHGGEALLAGPDRIAGYCSTVKAQVPCKVGFAMQTNATLITPKILEVLEQYEVCIGVSIDGDRESNQQRPFKNGKSSYERVRRALDLVQSRPEWSRLLKGCLAVIDLRHEPERVLAGLLELGTRGVDVLLPDAHHDRPPFRPRDDVDQTAYGRWLARFFDAWLRSGADVEVRFIEELMSLVLGGRSTLESLGAKSVDIVVIESNGDLEPVDTLKMVGRAATYLGFNVLQHSIDDAIAHPAIRSRMLGYDSLCETCRACPELERCGGGYLPHRYGQGRGFLNPSVYCHDIQYLIRHIRTALLRELRTKAV
jgi:uncharacterized protein